MRGCALHYSCGAARRVRSHIPGALSILKGAVPDRARGLGHMAPTYLGREPGIERSDGRRGSALFMRASRWFQDLDARSKRRGMRGHSRISTPEKIKDGKAQLRREAIARRDAIPARARQLAAET